MLPFVLGMAVGYLLDPLVGHLERRGISRAAAAGVMVATTYGVAIFGIFLLAPLLARQTIDLVTNLPAYAHTAYDRLSPLLHRLLATSGTPRVADLAATAAQRATELLGPIAGGLIGHGLAVINLTLLLAITPLVAFYLLRDWPKLLAEVDSWLPPEHAATIRAQARAIDAGLAGFAGGAALVWCTLPVYYAIALTSSGSSRVLRSGSRPARSHSCRIWEPSAVRVSRSAWPPSNSGRTGAASPSCSASSRSASC